MITVAILTKKEGCSAKDIEWASLYNIPEANFKGIGNFLIGNKIRKVLIFETILSDILSLCECTGLDGWYFIKTESGWDFWK